MLERELFNLLETATDAAISVTDQGEICSWNKAAERLLGYSRAEVLGKSCFDLLQGCGTLGTRVCVENCSIRDCAAKRVEIPNFDLEMKMRSGRRRWLDVSVLVYENSRKRRRLIVHLMRDMTEERKNEERLHKMTALSRQLVTTPDVIGQPAPVSALSDHEREILHLFSVGTNSTAIARKLGITPQTLRNHLHHINQKLHTHNRLEAVTHAIQRKLV